MNVSDKNKAQQTLQALAVHVSAQTPLSSAAGPAIDEMVSGLKIDAVLK